MQNRYLLALSVTGLVCFSTASTHANTIVMEFYNPSPASITCNGLAPGACLGFTGDTSVADLSPTIAEEQPQQGSPNSERDYLNDLLAALDPARDPVSYREKTDQPGSGFTTTRQYFSIKQANDLFYFENTSGGAVTVVLKPPDNNDYSHWTEYGQEVPLPAAVWFFGSALLGLATIKGRRNRR